MKKLITILFISLLVYSCGDDIDKNKKEMEEKPYIEKITENQLV